jgi:hypothetical protein
LQSIYAGFPQARPVYRNHVYREDAYRNDVNRDAVYRNDVNREAVYRNDVSTSQPQSNVSHSSASQSSVSKSNKVAKELLDFENRQFSYDDLKRITNNFQNNIGTGAFGSVYAGVLGKGDRVAVKIHSHSSSQGVREFLAEVY